MHMNIHSLLFKHTYDSDIHTTHIYKNNIYRQYTKSNCIKHI